jgi:hypothetical protein
MLSSSPGWAQHTERTLDEIKTEAVHRAEVGGYPLIGLDPADVQEAFKSVHTRNPDEWATAFMGVASKYETEAKSLEKTEEKLNAESCRRRNPSTRPRDLHLRQATEQGQLC